MSVSGYAEMGISGGSAAETQFHTDIDVTFSMSGTTDNGLTFGAAVDLDEAGNITGAETSSDNDGVAVFISGASGTLTMGDTDGGFDWGMSEVPGGPGGIADDNTGHAGWNGNGGLDGLHDGVVLRYNHTIGGLGFAVSVEMDDTAGATEGDEVVGLGLRYSVGDLGIGIGYQTGSDNGPLQDETVMGMSLSYSMGDLALGANYSVRERDGFADEGHMAIGMSYTMDAITLGVNYGQYTDRNGIAGEDTAGWGFSAGYDLGGGASILFAFGDTTDGAAAVAAGASPTGAAIAAVAESSTWSLGLAMSF